MVEQVVTDVSKFLLGAISELVKTEKGGLALKQIHTSKYQSLKPQATYPTLYPLLEKKERQEFNKSFVEHLDDFQDPGFSPLLYSRLAADLTGSYRDLGKTPIKASNLDQVFFNDTLPSPLSRLKLIFNLRERRKSFLYDADKDVVHDYDYEFIMMRVRYLLEDNWQSWVETNSEDCVLDYRPFQPRISQDSKLDAKIFNTWSEATWRKGWSIEEETAYPVERPAEIDAYMRAFAKTEEDVHSLLAWCRDATFGRAEPILVLCGLPGVGKNLFIETICGALVGMANYRQASRGFHRTQFHNNVSQCRLFFLDEMNLTPEARETLKAYHNGVATIERKGKDVGDPERIYASFALANNHKQKISLEYTDRKFFVPMLSDRPLLESMTQSQVDALLKYMADPACVRQFAAHLHHTYPAGSATRFKKNEFFKELCINSYPYFFRRFYSFLALMSEVTNKRFMKNLGRSNVDYFEIKDALAHFESNFNVKIAEIYPETSGGWTAQSLIYGGIEPKPILPTESRATVPGAAMPITPQAEIIPQEGGIDVMMEAFGWRSL